MDQKRSVRQVLPTLGPIVAAVLVIGATTADPLQSAFRAAHRDHSALLLDKFAEATADSSAIGQPFKYVGSLKDGQATGGHPGPWYAYSEGKLELNFPLRQSYTDEVLRFSGPQYLVGIIGGSRQQERSYTGTNAYGASTRVRVEKLLQDGLVFMDGPEGERSPIPPLRMPPFPSAQGSYVRPPSGYPAPPSVYSSRPGGYSVQLALPGPTARKVALDAGLVIEGTIERLPDGKLNICKGMFYEASIDHPVRVYGSECWVGASVERVAFIRRSTGEVLKEWGKAP